MANNRTFFPFFILYGGEISILLFTGNTIRLNFPDSLPKENGTGRVEVYHDNQWGTVCDRSWDGKDAFVVCDELGLVKAIHETKRAKYGQGIGPVWLNNVQCTGGERSLLDCPHSGWGNVGRCTHGNDAGVKCLQTGEKIGAQCIHVEF